MEYYSVFFVNRGLLCEIDRLDANYSVKGLQKSIQQKLHIKPPDQVLLDINGVTLDPSKLVIDYVKLDTNSSPIFLFDRKFSLSERDEVSSRDELKKLTHKIDDVISKIRLVFQIETTKQFLELPTFAEPCLYLSQAAIKMCARLVLEHTYLSNGWTALMTNLSFSLRKTGKRLDKALDNYKRVIELREKASELLEHFTESIEQLKRIELPVELLETISISKEMTLYEFIQSIDKNSSLEDLVSQCKLLLNRADDWNLSPVLAEIAELEKYSRSKDYCEIKGINMRLNQLDNSLVKHEATDCAIKQLAKAIAMTPENIDPEKLQATVRENKKSFEDIFEHLRELKKAYETFDCSKQELITNILSRMNGWVLDTYAKLTVSLNNVVAFEEKFRALKNRIDLIQQIKEAPVIFASAITEVIRRESFRKEFLAWFELHTSLCKKLESDENKVRADFLHKIQKHFLRCFFPGIDDTVPKFYIENIGKFDQELPLIKPDYIHSLRKNIAYLEPCLRVCTPQVFARLLPKDLQTSFNMSATIRRDDSFFTNEQISNYATLHRGLPSTTWLAGDESVDMSPRDMPAMMARSVLAQEVARPAHFHTAPSLQNLEECNESITVSPGSVPIRIPGIPPQSMSAIGHGSKNSSQFSTPDEHFNSKEQFPIEGCTQRSITLEQLKPVAVELVKMREDLIVIKTEFLNYREAYEKDLAPEAEKAKISLKQAIAAQFEKHDAEVKNLTDELNIIRLACSSCEDKLTDKKKEFEEKCAQLDDLRSEYLNACKRIEELEAASEEQRKVLSQERDDIVKKLTIDFELTSDNLREMNLRVIEEKDEKIRQLQRDFDKRSAELEKLKASADSDEYRNHIKSEIRQELEKEYKNRTEMIVKSHQQKVDDAIARNKKEIEYDMRKKILDLEHELKWTQEERNKFRVLLTESGVDNEKIVELNKAIQIAAINDARQLHVSPSSTYLGAYANIGVQTDFVEVGSEFLMQPKSAVPERLRRGSLTSSSSIMETSVMKIPNYSLDRPQSPEECLSAELENNRNGTCTAQIQTKMLMKNIDAMINVQDISDGALVIVLWSEAHQAFTIFSTSPYLYFVKESSAKRHAIPRVPTIVRVIHMDLCVIRKTENRYSMPIDSRVYRVEVEPLHSLLN